MIRGDQVAGVGWQVTGTFSLLAVWLLASSVAAQTPPPMAGVPPAAPAVAPDSAAPPVVADSAVSPPPAGKESTEELDQELLRDPFWPVGFFPKDWQNKALTLGSPDMGASGWKLALAKIRVSGTSRLGGKTAAIINGELKSVGEQIETLHEGKTYQWEIVEITADGQVELKKLGIR